ncbi:cubilin-like [Panonychus citri]|uniref:cubilin-like n=1 Tax=Panonychus citri TaxID=50023 RepID=UPI002307DA76|nr:cubilin-like [Panonychus citri]
MATIRGILIVPVLLLLFLFHVQSSSYFQKLRCKQIERCDESLTNSTLRFLNSPNPFEFFREISKLKTKNKLKNGSCDSSLDGSSCRDERKIKSSQIYSDTVADDKSNVQCGGVLNSANGIVTSPNYPHPFNVSSECLWKIKTSDGSRLVVNLIDLELDSSLNCTQNVLIIYDGPTDQDSQLLVACNQKQLDNNLITSRGNELTIKLITNESTDYVKGFKFSYETDCNNFIEDISGSIESPINQSSKSLNCSWTIKVPKGNNISLVIEKFKSSDSSSCSTSYLSFIDNQTTKTFCQSIDVTDLDPVFITDNQVQIDFVNLNPDHQLYFRLEWKPVGCGGDIYGSEGELVSPNYPDSYPNGLICLWTIHGKPGHKIEMYIYEYQIERNDSLQIFDGPNTRSHRLLNLSGNLYVPLQISTIRNEATIFLEVDENFNGKGFRLNYKAVKSNRCDFSYHTIKGSIASPNYPNRFVEQSSCRWALSNDEAYVAVIIEDLDIPWSINCTDYYLRFLTPKKKELARFCGHSFPTHPIQSDSSNTIYVDYYSKSQHNGRGFKANYFMNCDLSRYIFPYPLPFTSLHYPATTNGGSSCSYHFKSDNSSDRTYFHFVDLAIKSNLESYLEIHEETSNGSTQVVRYNDSDLPLPRIYGAPFHIHTKGDVIFKFTHFRDLDNCSSELNSWEGTFSSPGYPNDYPPSRTCVWKINLAPGNFIFLKFHSFDIQYDQFCALDHLEIREENESGKLIGRFCGSNLPQLNSTQYYPSLWIRFKSHANGSASGFKASYKTIKDVKINSDSGKIGSFAYPRLFSSENNQSWTIKTSDFNKIKFKLESIDILDDSFDSSCTNSSVTIYDGPSVNSSILGQFCGYRTGDLPIYTTSSIAYVHFKPNFYISRFLLSWTSVSENIPFPLIDDPNYLCKYTASLKLNQNLTLLSSSYPNDLSCSWTISSPMGTQLQVKINEMDIKLHSDEKCSKNRVSFYDYSFDHEKDWKINRIICDSNEKLFTLHGNQSLISFFNYGGLSTNLKGFNITVRPICGGTFYGPTGNIDSSLLGPFETCSWAIIVLKGQRVELKFKSFNLGSSDNHCANGYLSIRNGNFPNSRFIGHYCGSNLPKKIISDSNQFFISTYVPASEQFEFSLSYRQVSAPCKYHVELNESNPSAIIQLPGYPNPPDEYFTCDWVIKVPIDKVIRIDFDIPDHDKKCDLNTTYVDIYDGPSNVLPKLGRFCPIARTTSVVTSDNRMDIHFVTKGGAGSSSFKATVHLHVCGGNFVANRYILVKSPSYPEPYGANLTCNYNIYSEKISQIVAYQLESVDLPSNDNCSSGDYLAIYEYGQSGDLLTKVCGTRNYTEEDTISPQTNHLFMVFKSDSEIAGKGFKIWLTYGKDDDCNVLVTEDTGVISSPRFPKIYPGPRNCTYIFMETPDERIVLNFTHYNLKSADNLCRNKLQIDYNPNILMDSKDFFKLEMTSKNITLPCESKYTNYVIKSPNNVLIVYFETYSGLDAGQGFRAEYSKEKATECGGRIDSNSTSIISTNFSQPIDDSRISCVWYIEIETDEDNVFGLKKQITPWISFEKIEVLGSAENDSICSDGKITLGLPKASPYNELVSIENLEFCGNSSKAITAISPISIAYFSLLTATFNRTRGYRGFEATYHISKCGGSLKANESNITSPGWPNENYPIDTVCVWSFDVLEETNPVVELVFEEFELEADCSKDYVEIYEFNSKKTTKIGRYCSKDKPPFIKAHSGISIVFRSDGDTTSKGFSLNIKSIKNENNIPSCDQYKATWANSYDPPTSYKPNQHCEEILEVDPMSQLNLTFVNRFDIENSVNCSKDYLDIDEWRNNSWHHFGRYCGYNSPGSIIFKENKAKLIFHSDGDDRLGDGFKYYSTKYCRSTIDKRGKGTIQSNGYPDSYSIDYCEWTFKGQEPDDMINIQFEFFSLGSELECDENYLHVDVYTKNELTGIHQVERYCCVNEPKRITSQGNLKIIANSVQFVISKGFKFDYQIVPANLTSSP